MALPGLRTRAPRALAVFALVTFTNGAAGCFSGDDFSVCTRDSECAGDHCVQGRCVTVTTADATPPGGDATLPTDAGPNTDARSPGADAEPDDDCVGVDFDGVVDGRSFSWKITVKNLSPPTSE